MRRLLGALHARAHTAGALAFTLVIASVLAGGALACARGRTQHSARNLKPNKKYMCAACAWRGWPRTEKHGRLPLHANEQVV